MIKILNDELAKEYQSFLYKNPNTLFFNSFKYKSLLQEFLRVEPYYFLYINEHGEIEGALPSFYKEGEYGSVLNSTPFYGSNGGIIEYKNNLLVKKALMEAFYEFANEKKCVSATIITSPFEENIDFYEQNFPYTYRDYRIGQVTSLPLGNINDVETELMNSFHYKTRNAIRKAIKSNVTVLEDKGDFALQFLYSTHVENMVAINGLYKPKEFFELIPRHFSYGEDYSLFIAYHKQIPIAALLVFYFNKTVEYFCPVSVNEYRGLQPLSLLVFHAMKKAAINGYKWWNWGGTWRTQNGVYNFKKRWGTRDLNYYYYTKIFDTSILSVSKEEVLSEYPYFYLFPFDEVFSK